MNFEKVHKKFKKSINNLNLKLPSPSREREDNRLLLLPLQRHVPSQSMDVWGSLTLPFQVSDHPDEEVPRQDKGNPIGSVRSLPNIE